MVQPTYNDLRLATKDAYNITNEQYQLLSNRIKLSEQSLMCHEHTTNDEKIFFRRERISIVGENGSGKTTLLKTLLNILYSQPHN
jgi:ABC-type cobalamin/Fe3+-siderophores transport system ATPase subunit